MVGVAVNRNAVVAREFGEYPYRRLDFDDFDVGAEVATEVDEVVVGSAEVKDLRS